jgi:aminoglycoside phosphotransferase (APT) family kinase protein
VEDAFEAAALRIVKRHFGRRPRRLARLSGGLSNEVFECDVGQDRCVIRLNRDATSFQRFLREQWAIERVAAADVPVPRVLEVGNDATGAAYIVTQRIDGVVAGAHPHRHEVLRQLGQLAARVHGVPTRGYGMVFDWSANRLSRCDRWGAYLDRELNVSGRMALLRRHRMLSDGAATALERSLQVMRRWRKRAALQHGDLRLKNVLLDPDSGGIVALIDWDQCLSAPPPYWDLSIALHDLGVDEKEALLQGYGMTPRRFQALADDVRLLNVLNYAPAVEQAAAARDGERLAWLRLRLRGALDMAAAR